MNAPAPDPATRIENPTAIVTADVTYNHPSREIPTPVAVLNSGPMAQYHPEVVDAEAGVYNLTVTQDALDSLLAEGTWDAVVDRFWIHVEMP